MSSGQGMRPLGQSVGALPKRVISRCSQSVALVSAASVDGVGVAQVGDGVAQAGDGVALVSPDGVGVVQGGVGVAQGGVGDGEVSAS